MPYHEDWPPGAAQPSAELLTASSVQVLEPSGTPAGLLTRTEPFQVAMEFEIVGLSKALLGLLSYEVLYYAESVGPGPEYRLGAVAKQTVDGQARYNATTPPGHETVLEVAAGTMDPGVYRIGAVVTFTVACPNTTPKPFPITGFTEGPAIQVA